MRVRLLPVVLLVAWSAACENTPVRPTVIPTGVPVTRTPAPAPPPRPFPFAKGLHIDSVDVLEFEDPANSGHWYHAPRIRVSLTEDASALTVTSLRLQSATVGAECRVGLRVTGASVDLLEVSPGHYRFVFRSYRSVPGTRVEAMLMFTLDGTGESGLMFGYGSVVSGPAPSPFETDVGATDADCTVQD